MCTLNQTLEQREAGSTMDSVAAQNKAIAGSIMKTVLDETGEAVFVGQPDCYSYVSYSRLKTLVL